MTFRFVDLFCGIGGFHAALSALGGECVFASDIDEDARNVYADNWNFKPSGDINDFANEKVEVPEHDVLVGGFPCQPFSKSGYQRGMDETRGTLFWNIAQIIKEKSPSVVLLENVRNLVGPRHIHEWQVIINTLKDLNYRVSESPLILSPHQLKKDFGGRPQVRERVFISATKYPQSWKRVIAEVKPPEFGWELGEPKNWDLRVDLPLESEESISQSNLSLSKEEKEWLRVWQKFVQGIRRDSGTLPGFPLWFDTWPLKRSGVSLEQDESFPEWKNEFIVKNLEFFGTHRKAIQAWYRENKVIDNFPPSRRKLEWQAQEATSIKNCLIHFRPSGIRVKKVNYVPALVAMNQTSVLGREERRLSVREAARLQGFPDWFQFNSQPDAKSYKQLGNAVNVGVVYQVLKAQIMRDFDLLKNEKPELLKSILGSPSNPDLVLADRKNLLKVKDHMNYINLQQELPLRIVN
jgi:DNA (cytosine-5)-methyltransferase 1